MLKSTCVEKYMQEGVVACEGCDLLVSIPDLNEGSRAQCPRCGNILMTIHRNALERITAFSFTAIIFLITAHLFPFLALNVQGQERVITLWESIRLLSAIGEMFLAVCIFLTTVLVPAFFLLGIFYILLVMKKSKINKKNQITLRIILSSIPWAMGEIFVIGVLISLIKIVSLADVILGLSFWGYILFSGFMTATLLHIDKVQLWNLIEEHIGHSS